MNEKHDDHERDDRQKDADDFNLEELIADFAADQDGDEVEDTIESTIPGEFSFALENAAEDDEDGDSVEIDVEATGEYSRIIGEYGGSSRVDIVQEDEDAPDAVADESTREFVLEELEGGIDVDNTVFMTVLGDFENETAVEEPEIPDAVGDTEILESMDGIADLAELRDSIAESSSDDADSGLDALELEPVVENLNIEPGEGDTIEVPEFDADDPLGLLADDIPGVDDIGIAPEEDAPVDDFLGLGSIQTGVRKGAAAEVLFEGIEMSFDEQIGAVTLAELLLSQGKRDEAEQLYRELADNNGVTYWVESRLREFASPE